jgi:hypothetical protein
MAGSSPSFDRSTEAAGAIAVQAVPDVEVLLEVMPQREVEERPLRCGQLHRRRQPALHDGQVAHRQVPVEAIDVAAHLQTGIVSKAGKARGVDTWPSDDHHSQLRGEPLRQGVGGDDLLEECPSDAASAHSHDADLLVLAVAELGSDRGDLVRIGRGEAGDVPGEREVRLGPTADAREVAAEGVRNDVVGVPDEDGGVPDAGVARDVLDHLGVVIGGQEGLLLAAVGHREIADEVGHPDVVAPL